MPEPKPERVPIPPVPAQPVPVPVPLTPDAAALLAAVNQPASAPLAAPPAPYLTWCEWAQDNWRKALEGLNAVSSGGVSGYKIGTRAVQYRGASEQAKIVEYWKQMVDMYCPVGASGAPMPGQDTAFRVIQRDV